MSLRVTMNALEAMLLADSLLDDSKACVSIQTGIEPVGRMLYLTLPAGIPADSGEFQNHLLRKR